ncbi:MAG: polysaccharide pyruvyl transferase family protein [Bacteroidales bacterium]|nr:polysaccharide pyruvyl transferase family protein [Bacteroidales bacterium]
MIGKIKTVLLKIKIVVKIYSLYRLILVLRNYLKEKFLRVYWHQFFPKKPTVINLNANDICNSHCVMCNIWKREKEFEFSPSELENILKNKLFSKIEHVGITGGEPTLREDIVALYDKVINSLPKLKGVSIISNAIESEIVIYRILEIYELCKKHNTHFSVMISLDGINEIHDIIRGTKNNFVSSMYVINYLKNNTTIPFSIGCTISKANVWYVDELLDFMKENNIYGRFRVAEYINRLYNSQNTSSIRNFSEEEKHHLQLFFKKLQFTYEKNETYKRTYESIINILGGGKRLIGCPYHSEGIVLNSKGEISYCAPKSDIIGNALEKNANKLFKKKIKHRRKIIAKHCENCIHDYHYKLTFNEYKELQKQYFLNRIFDINTLKRTFFYTKLLINNKKTASFQLFIVGWYGTETVGDKAILAGIIKKYKEQYASIKIIIASIYPFVTINTLKELNIDAEVVGVKTLKFLKYAKTSDETIMGGGPLMNIDEMDIPIIAFSIAKKYNKTTKIYGCGIGPISGKYIDKLKRILEYTDKIYLRDSCSKTLLKTICPNKEAEVIGDPSVLYLKYRAETLSIHKQNILSCFLREWPRNYTNFDNETFIQKRNYFEQRLAERIKKKAIELQVEKIEFNHMHNFTVGSDDRDFSRRFIKEYFSDFCIPTEYDKQLSTVEKIMIAMKSSKYNICMRFHSVVFANTLETEFEAIDYTNGGKIFGYLTDENKSDRMISINQILKEES